MSLRRKKWTLEDKLAAVQLIKSKGVSKSNRAYNLSATTLSIWEKLHDEYDSNSFSGHKKSQTDQEISHLKREIREPKILIRITTKKN